MSPYFLSVAAQNHKIPLKLQFPSNGRSHVASLERKFKVLLYVSFQTFRKSPDISFFSPVIQPESLLRWLVTKRSHRQIYAFLCVTLDKMPYNSVCEYQEWRPSIVLAFQIPVDRSARESSGVVRFGASPIHQFVDRRLPVQ